MKLKMKLFLTLFIGVITLQFSGCYFMLGGKDFDETSTKTVNRIIEENPLYKDVGNLCNQIPLPHDFKLLGKRGAFNIKGIEYFYESKIDFDVSKESFKNYFLQNGWKEFEPKTFKRAIEFRNQKYVVTIYYGLEDADYSIYCGLLSPLEKEEVTNR